MQNPTGLFGLDFETYCDLDLFEVGLDRYLAHPSFTVTLAGIATLDIPEVDPAPMSLLPGAGRDSRRTTFLQWIHHLTVRLELALVAHNAQFERACLQHLGVDLDTVKIIDSAVLSRMFGGSSKLEYAARQFTDERKLESGPHLIKKFACPHEDFNFQCPTQEEVMRDHLADWLDYSDYCGQDARAGLEVASKVLLALEPRATRRVPLHLPTLEYDNELITHNMNTVGWTVDIPLVIEMQRQYLLNTEQLTQEFHDKYDPKNELNLNSPMQLTKWCAERRVKLKSFNKDSVDKTIPKIKKKLESMQPTDQYYTELSEVLALLEVKRELGGTALKKLQVILDTSRDSKLRYQYMHAGAGQTYRTTGKGVQMQNLKRLGSRKLDDMTRVFSERFDNETLGENLRQVFTSRDPEGKLFVGDFSSVESRGLAWLAGAMWKLDAFRAGKDMYKVAASGIYKIPYEEVTKDQRQTGKVAELSCGYGGAKNSVEVFANVYGLGLTEEQQVALTNDWRADNPEIVKLWDDLGDGLKSTVATGRPLYLAVGPGAEGTLIFRETLTPDSLKELHPGARSIQVELCVQDQTIMQRVFHGCYSRGTNIGFFKPGETKAGPTWSNSFIDRKTSHRKFYELYGGKLAGIITQSMCRELFFYSLRALSTRLTREKGERQVNWEIIGQFHDEIVVDWWPGFFSEESMERFMSEAMTSVPPGFEDFPLEADIKSDYRYIK